MWGVINYFLERLLSGQVIFFLNKGKIFYQENKKLPRLNLF